MALEPGQLVSKHVRLVRRLKSGGMGSVWVADHLALNTQVAVKFIVGDHVANPELSERFKREATSAARIKSPHVVQVHDHGVTETGLPFIVMELLEGEDLSTRLKRGLMSVDDVETIVQQTCRVLARSHKLGVVHRDIKPANLFLMDSDGVIFVKLLDFGVAKMGSDKSDLTNSGVMVGTLCYMSPEQLLDARNVDHRADLWSLAVVAYRALTGQLPFKDENGLGALVLAVDRGIFAQASSLVSDIPESLDAWFAKAFRRQVDARFTSAREMANELAIALGRKVAPDEPPSPQDRLTLPDRTDPATPISRTKIGLNPPASTSARTSQTTIDALLPPGRSSAEDSAATVGGMSAQPIKKRSSFVAWALSTVLLVVVVVIGGEIALQRFRPKETASASATSTAATTIEAAPAAAAPAEASASNVAASAAMPQSSSAPEPRAIASASTSASSPPSGPNRRAVPPAGVPPKTEKDYGF